MSPSDTQNKTKVIERIQKLQAMADTERSKSPEEAANAATMIQDLLTKYNLELREVESHVRPDGYESTYYDLDPGKGQSAHRQGLIEWRKMLMNALAETNFCQMFTLQVPVKKGAKGPRREYSDVQIIGQLHNIEVVLAMYKFLTFEIERLAELTWLQNYLATYTRGFGSTFSQTHKSSVWKKSFKDGAVLVIGRRLHAQRQASDADANTKAMVLVIGNELRLAVERYTGSRVQPRQTLDSQRDWDGIEAGKAAGARIAINKHVSDGPADSRKEVKALT